MKKLFAVISILAIFVCFSKPILADNYVCSLTSYTVAGGTGAFAAATYPLIDGPCLIDKLVFSTTDTLSASILIGVYDEALATTTATVDAYFVLAGTNTTSYSGNYLAVEYPYYNPLKLNNPAFFKVGGDTSKRIWLNVQYR
jgi:multisubunit Na+/H+ antiporter MnhF subunit